MEARVFEMLFYTGINTPTQRHTHKLIINYKINHRNIPSIFNTQTTNILENSHWSRYKGRHHLFTLLKVYCVQEGRLLSVFYPVSFANV